jgi:hypothetical protein
VRQRLVQVVEAKKFRLYQDELLRNAKVEKFPDRMLGNATPSAPGTAAPGAPGAPGAPPAAAPGAAPTPPAPTPAPAPAPKKN